MSELILGALGFLLVISIFSEEFRLLLQWLNGILRQYPYLKLIVYPLAVLILLAITALLVNSLLQLMCLKFSYD
jgi:uncharacterized membrane protein (DUF106 family)